MGNRKVTAGGGFVRPPALFTILMNMRQRFIVILGICTFILSFVYSLTPALVQAHSYRTRSSDLHIRGYFRSNGAYIQPHYRSKADGYRINNYICLDHGRCK